MLRPRSKIIYARISCIALQVCAFAGPLSGCAKHPVDVLLRESQRYDRKASDERATSLSDSAYFVPKSDALAAAVQHLGGESVPEVTKNSAGTDWTYDGTVGIDRAAGEYYDQTRSRRMVSFTTVGPEVQVEGKTLMGKRRLSAAGAAGSWSDASEGVELQNLRGTLSGLEQRHLGAMTAPAAARLLQDFESVLPAGYSIVERTETGLVAQRTVAKRKDRERKGLWATWEARRTITAVVVPATKIVQVMARTEHRFSTEAGEGEWKLASTSSTADATDWLAGAMRTAVPSGRAAFGAPLLEAVATRSAAFSQPPSPPKLRTMGEIEEIVTARAYETGTGNFTVCVDMVLVNPKDASGEDWDLPYATEMLDVTTTGATAAGDALGQINDDTLLGQALDKGLLFMTDGVLNKQRAMVVAKLTAGASGWVAKRLPVLPDVQGSLVIGGQEFSLSESEDSLRVKPDQCATADFRPGSVAFQAAFWDVDLYEHDPLGSCTVKIQTAIAGRVRGVPCGWTRVFPGVTYNFSFEQIEKVGLPPPE
jgi:hypothetical protein